MRNLSKLLLRLEECRSMKSTNIYTLLYFTANLHTHKTSNLFYTYRKHNYSMCSEFRNTQTMSNDQVMPTVNSTYTPAWRSNKHENHHQAHLVNAPGGSNLSTTPAVYFDNRTNDKAIKLCPIQQPGIQTNKHESNTYSHLRTTTNDSDGMYDHTVRNAVRNTCDRDYDVAHIRITEDDYNVSGNYHHLLTTKEDPVNT